MTGTSNSETFHQTPMASPTMTSSSNGNRKRTRPEEWNNVEPSQVIHLNDLPEHTLEIDLEQLLQNYGKVREITIMPNRHQALVEFEDQCSADNVINRSSEQPLIIGRNRITATYSTSKSIINRNGMVGDREDRNCPPTENKILLLTIYNAHYPINVDVIHQVTSRHGKVLRIVIFRKREVQAMVEFGSISEARATKRHINGADIYSGSCSLKVEFAKQTKLSVKHNDSESWDYEAEVFGYPEETHNRPRASLLGGYEQFPQEKVDRYPSQSRGLVSPIPFMTNMGLVQHVGDNFGYSVNGPYGASGPGSAVLMIYKLNMTLINCDRLFNLFCIFGNVMRIKFLRTKEGSAMVEMQDSASAERALPHIPRIPFAGNLLSVQPSRQAHIVHVDEPYELPDGSLSFKDYTKSRNNRYNSSQNAGKNRIYPPSHSLHYWNCPPNFTAEEIKQVFESASVAVPSDVTVFPSTERTSTGLLKWNSLEEACEALIICNHTNIEFADSRYPLVMRLSFAGPSKERN